MGTRLALTHLIRSIGTVTFAAAFMLYATAELNAKPTQRFASQPRLAVAVQAGYGSELANIAEFLNTGSDFQLEPILKRLFYYSFALDDMFFKQAFLGGFFDWVKGFLKEEAIETRESSKAKEPSKRKRKADARKPEPAPEDLALLAPYVPAPGEWRLVPGTAFDNFRLTDVEASSLGLKGMGGSGAVLNHRTGSAYDAEGHMWYFWGGGGTSYGGNEIYRIDLDTLQIEMISAPSLLDDFIVDADGVTCPVPSVGPSAASTFDGMIWSPSTQTFFVYPTGYFCMNGAPSQNSVWEFDPNSLTWMPITETPDFDGYVFAEHDPDTDRIIVVSRDSIRELDPVTGQHSASVNLGQSFGQGSAVLDSDRLQLLLVNQQGIHSAPLDDLANVTPLASLPDGGDPHMGAVYAPRRSLLVMWSGDKEVRTFDPDTLEWALYTASDGPAMQGAGVFSKWIYIEELDVFAGYNNIDEGIWLYSLPGDAFGGGGTIANTAPVADAGSDQTVLAGDLVGVDGSASFDPDGDPLSHNWTLVSRPAGSSAILSDPQAIQPTFVADAVGNYTVQLTVDDGVLNSQDAVVVSSLNGAPVADAGPDQSVTVGDSVTLDGSGSHDPNGDTLTYAWSVISAPAGSTATLQNPGSENAMLVPDIAGLFVVGLFVHDGFEQSVADSVTIEASLADIITNQAPTDLLLSNNTVPSDATNGTLVGKVTVTDPDAGDTALTRLTNDAGGRFAIGAASGEITVAKATLLQPGASYSITVQASDSGGLTYSESFTIEVSGVDAQFFFDGFERYTVGTKVPGNNFDMFGVWSGGTPGPWHQVLRTMHGYTASNSTLEIIDRGIPGTPPSGTKVLHAKTSQIDHDGAFAHHGRTGVKQSLIKKGDREVDGAFSYVDGDIVSVVQHMYIPSGASNNLWLTDPTINAPRWLVIGNYDGTPGYFRITGRKSDTALVINRLRFFDNDGFVPEIVSNPVAHWPTDRWFKLEVRFKVGHLPDDNPINYPDQGYGLGRGSYPFDASAPAWIQIMFDDVIAMQITATSRPGPMTEGVDTVINEVQTAITNTAHLAEVYITDFYTKGVSAAFAEPSS